MSRTPRGHVRFDSLGSRVANGGSSGVLEGLRIM